MTELTPAELKDMTISDLSALLRTHQGLLIIEDGWGHRYSLERVLAIGTQTDDPGLVLKVRREPVHPNA